MRRKNRGVIYKYFPRRVRKLADYDEKYSPVLSNGKPGIYNVMIMHCDKYGYPTADNFESIGWYDSLESLLKECKIGDRFFRDVIIDENTEILGKD